MSILLKCVSILLFFQISIILAGDVTDMSKNNTVLDLKMGNWTSCEEFLANSSFDRSKLIDVDWKIFYFWNFEREKSFHVKFRVPSKVLTDRFRVELDKELLPPVNWTMADMFMETSVDFSGLYIRTEVPGKYRLIPSLAFQVTSVPNIILGLKYVEPGYLGIMNCKYRLCYALAPVDRMPKPEDLKLAADKIGFYSENGRPYLMKTESRPSLSPIMMDDDDDDEDLEIAEHGFRANYIDDDVHGKDDDDED